ncbi:MAG: acyl-ACP--UDP-N-acetylglucosamine O-acyltransferase [Nitrospirae bacterium]|nr:acyl-ACP--UDP-N-acetylglucosamine O-acyltransferase [Nitrospirota bacterium]MCL5285456.1 acyl-ACP--UDP-N-acetylglucosamine O-acyltransferase [Nitrospirota bacterium]
MRPEIHPSAVVDSSVELGEDVRVGPFCVLRGPSRIGAGTLLMERVSVGPHVTMGERNRVHMGAIVGHEPQDHSFAGGVSETVIGDENEIREYVTIHRGTKEHSRTWIGNGTLLMAGSHVAHNCQVGDRAILANGVLLAGHVSVGAGAFLSGGVLVHQFIRIGRLALLRGGSRTSRDVPPFAIMDGTHTLRTINRVGLRRAGFSRETIAAIAAFYRDCLLSGTLDRERLASTDRSLSEIGEIVDFVLASRRGICFPGRWPDRSRPESDGEGE